MIIASANALHHIWITYADLFTDKEMKSDISDNDYYVHTLADLLVLFYALISYRFKFLQQYLMIIFYACTCTIAVANAHFERQTYSGWRRSMAELWIWYFCVCQMITSSNWVLEIISVAGIMLATLFGSTYHMREP